MQPQYITAIKPKSMPLIKTTNESSLTMIMCNMDLQCLKKLFFHLGKMKTMHNEY